MRPYACIFWTNCVRVLVSSLVWKKSLVTSLYLPVNILYHSNNVSSFALSETYYNGSVGCESHFTILKTYQLGLDSDDSSVSVWRASRLEYRHSRLSRDKCTEGVLRECVSQILVVCDGWLVTTQACQAVLLYLGSDHRIYLRHIICRCLAFIKSLLCLCSLEK